MPALTLSCHGFGGGISSNELSRKTGFQMNVIKGVGLLLRENQRHKTKSRTESASCCNRFSKHSLCYSQQLHVKLQQIIVATGLHDR